MATFNVEKTLEYIKNKKTVMSLKEIKRIRKDMYGVLSYIGDYKELETVPNSHILIQTMDTALDILLLLRDDQGEEFDSDKEKNS